MNAARMTSYANTERRVFLPAEVVLARFSDITGAPLVELAGQARTREISRLRQEAIWVMRRLSTASLAQIGRLLGGRNMATIDEALDIVAVRSAREEHYREYLVRIETRITASETDRTATLEERLRAVLDDPGLTDTDARRAALALLTGVRHAA